jgi:hemolysin activation/secretion protein
VLGQVDRRRLARVAGLFLAVLALHGLPREVCAQQAGPPAPAPHFDVQHFEVQGNTLLAAAEIEQALAPFKGGSKTFADLKQAADALEEVYHARGYSAAQVQLPEQDITQGMVRLRVVEPRVAKVVVEGNTVFGTDNVRRSLPSVKEGESPNAREIARDLQLTAEHPVKQTTVLLRAGASEDQVDVAVKVVDDKPWRAFLTLDNTGTSATGYYRSGIGYQHSNLFDRDHTLTAQYVTSPTYASKVGIYGVGYRIPFYDRHSSLDLVAGYSNVNSGTVQGLFTVSGSGTIAGAHWNYYPAKWGDVEQKLSLGLDYRAFNNQVMFEGQGIVPDITVHPASATYYGVVRGAESELTFNAGLAANIPGGNDGTEADFQRSRSTATSKYTILHYGFTYLRQLSEGWQARALFNGQYTGNALVSGEQFGLGGADSVRGYVLREVVNDRGYTGQLELYTPEMSSRLGLSDSYKTRLLAFYDFGSVKRNHALPGEALGDSIGSVGVGARVGYGKALSVRLDLARILEPTANRLTGSLRLGVAAAFMF